MKKIMTSLLLVACAVASAQDRIPENDWEWQKRNQGRRIEGGFTRYNMEIDHPELRQPKRCPPQRVIVVVRQPQLVFGGYIWNGFANVPFYYWQ